MKRKHRGVNSGSPRRKEINRPGLDEIAYRVGTHDSMLAQMRESATRVPGLRTLEPGDPAIAWMDAFATVGDVLTFYQERIANEGFLRTAVERRSLTELSKLVGYAPRPGVAASVFLAYDLEEGSKVTIAAGSRAQSLPGPGELPQSFETAEDLSSRAEWNNLQPAMTRPQQPQPTDYVLYLDGMATGLRKNDWLLLAVEGQKPAAGLRQVLNVEVDSSALRTTVTFKDRPATPPSPLWTPLEAAVNAVQGLTAPPADHPTNAKLLDRDVNRTFTSDTETTTSLITSIHPEISDHFYQALAQADVTPTPSLKVFAFRTQAAVFGNNALPRNILDQNNRVIGTEDWPLAGDVSVRIELRGSDQFAGEVANQVNSTPFLFVVTARTASVSSQVSFVSGSVPTLPPMMKFSQLADRPPGEFFFSFEKPITATFGLKLVSGGFRLANFNQQAMVEVLPEITDKSTAFGVAFGGSYSTCIKNRRIAADFTQNFVLTLSEPSTSGDTATIRLDAIYDQIAPGSWVVIERPSKPGFELITTKVKDDPATAAKKSSETDYGLSSRVTKLSLTDAWLDSNDLFLADVRDTSISAQSEELALSDCPIQDDIQGVTIELDGLYDGLESGRWLIVEGERTDVKGVRSAELVMLSAISHGVQAPVADPANKAAQPAPGEKTHSYLTLSNPLSYKYRRDTVIIHGNVIRATHGETRSEVLGSGDGSKPLQQFGLRQVPPPLTYLAASTPGGVENTLEVRVDNVLWHETDTMSAASASDRKYVVADAGTKPTVVFGNGVQGARLPSGLENVTAVYRTGAGKTGNVSAAQISLLAMRPLGVKGVVNPLEASGGADGDTDDQIRRNAPISVGALDRLVSVQDYADFARTFAGIEKAAAADLSDGRRRVVHLTIAGTGDVPISAQSDLFMNLQGAIAAVGDPHQPFVLNLRQSIVLVLSARIGILPNYQFETVTDQIAGTLQATFSFARQELGQDVYLSQVISVIQSVAGVRYADVDMFDGFNESDFGSGAAIEAKLVSVRNRTGPKPVVRAGFARLDSSQSIQPAQIAYFKSDVKDALILKQK